MGTRYEDQPAEHWAGAESLDPTPVWKQYVLIAGLLVVGLVLVVIVAVTALAPTFAAPPALVFGDRLVLAATDIPAIGASPRLIAAPLVDDARSFFLTQPEKGTIIAVRAHWSPGVGVRDCRVFVANPPPARFAAGQCDGAHDAVVEQFDGRGAPIGAAGMRGLDQYLVSVSGDRVIVNLSRVIEADARTAGPVPTGIPQPQATP